MQRPPSHQHLPPEWHIYYNQWAYTDMSLLPKGHCLHLAFTQCCTFCGFWQIMTCIHHYSVTQSSFTAPQILCSLPVLPSLPQALAISTTDLFYCLHSFAFFSISYRISIGFSNCLLSHSVHLIFSISFHGLELTLALIISVEWMYHSRFIHLPSEGHHASLF